MLTLNFRWFCLSYHLFVLIINLYVGNMVASNKVVLKLFGETFTTLLITLRNETSYNLIRQNHSD
jgi:intracellular septation protein A